MRVSELAAQENVRWLMPPARRFYGVMICLLLASLATDQLMAEREGGLRPLTFITGTHGSTFVIVH